MIYKIDFEYNSNSYMTKASISVNKGGDINGTYEYLDGYLYEDSELGNSVPEMVYRFEDVLDSRRRDNLITEDIKIILAGHLALNGTVYLDDENLKIISVTRISK